MQAPSRRRGEELPDDHPTKDIQLEPGDCIADVPAEKLEELVEYYKDQPFDEGEPVPPDVELV